MKKTILFSFVAITMHVGANAQSCNPDSLVVRGIKACNTDNNINWELQNHQVYINPDCPSNNKLILHLVGTFDNPNSTTFLPTLAANNGYKVISLKYPNNVSGTSSCKTSSDFDCHWKYRQEIVSGTDTSSHVAVDTSNCILNRFQKLLIYLDNEYPGENWGKYLINQDSIDWSDITVSGHSQGGGHAAFIAKNFAVDRVLMFASPNEYSSFYAAPASWISMPGLTPDSRYYGFGNLYDEIIDFSEQFLVWNTMNLDTFGDSVWVDNTACPYSNSRILYTSDTSTTGIAAQHSSVIVDNYTPISMGEPIFLPVWEYMLGLCGDSTLSINHVFSIEGIEIYPNPGSGTVYISAPKPIVKIELINSVGSILEVYEPNSNLATLNLETYTGLLYIKVFIEGNKSFVKKLIRH
ncbi:MAG: T9SS type A sorting domain-containing protein [Cytophagales bacterium]|nr:T9SS type A sorting domain-containing protein [Cytophagales bacterium]